MTNYEGGKPSDELGHALILATAKKAGLTIQAR